MSRQLVLIPSYRYRRQMMLGCASYFVHLMPGWLSAPFAHQVGVPAQPRYYPKGSINEALYFFREAVKALGGEPLTKNTRELAAAQKRLRAALAAAPVNSAD
jgi:hypothetical protein